MTLLILAYLGGVLTILSPCILPVLPFVFARAGQSFTRSALPMLAGMAITFALVAMLVTVGGSWAVHANQYGRYVALAILALFGLTLLLPRFADRIMHPFVAAGARLSASAEQGDAAPSAFSSVLLGIGTLPVAAEKKMLPRFEKIIHSLSLDNSVFAQVAATPQPASQQLP